MKSLQPTAHTVGDGDLCLSDRQLDGFACRRCGEETPAQAPVGFGPRGQLFECSRHQSSIIEWCTEFAALFGEHGRPIVSLDDARLDALVAHGLVDVDKLAGGIEPDEAIRLGSLYFDRFADDKPDQPLDWPAWAQTVHVETSDYPVIGIRFEAIVSTGDTVSATWIKTFAVVLEDFTTPKYEARTGEIWFTDDPPVLEVLSGDRRLDLLELPDVLTFADAIAAAARMMQTGNTVAAVQHDAPPWAVTSETKNECVTHRGAEYVDGDLTVFLERIHGDTGEPLAETDLAVKYYRSPVDVEEAFIPVSRLDRLTRLIGRAQQDFAPVEVTA